MAYVLNSSAALGSDRYFVRVERDGDYVLSAYVSKVELSVLIEMFRRLGEVAVIDAHSRHQ